MIHRRTHPVDVPGCFACRIASVQLAPSAVGSQEASVKNSMDRDWSRDMRAYATLRKQGLQPTQIDGCHSLALGAKTADQVEGRVPL